jgi:hypothetical protein
MNLQSFKEAVQKKSGGGRQSALHRLDSIFYPCTTLL